MADDSNMAGPENGSHVRFYGSFVGVLKWSVIAIALLLIAMAVFLA